MFWNGYDESYINNFEAHVNAVDVDKAKAVIAKYFSDNKLQIVLIGKSEVIKTIAVKYAPFTEVQLKDDAGKGF
jgi:predicted Zn-dependent peptidase